MTRDGDWGGASPQHGHQHSAARGPQHESSAPTHSQIESLLHNLIQRIEENDKRYGTAIGSIEERLNTLSSRAGRAGAEDMSARAEALNRVGAQAADLAQRIRDNEQAYRPQRPDDAFRSIEDRISSFASSLQQGEGHAPDTGRWPNPQPSTTDEHLEQRIADAAAGFEQTLAAGHPTEGLEQVNARLDELVHRFDSALDNRSGKSTLHSIEAQLDKLSTQLAQAQQQYSRVDAIENNLLRVMEWAQAAESQIETVARKAAQETALSIDGGAGDIADRLDAVQRELEALNARSREIDGRTIGALESMNSALTSLSGQLGQDSNPRAADPVQPAADAQAVPKRENLSTPAAPPEQVSVVPQEEDRSRVGASIPDYRKAPEVPEQHIVNDGAAASPNSEAGKGAQASAMLDDDDFLASARRAAAAAAAQPVQKRERRSLFSSLRRDGASNTRTPIPKEKRKSRPVLVVAAILLLLASAALLYGKLKDQAGGAPVAIPLPQTETPPPGKPEKKDNAKLPTGPQVTPPNRTRRPPLVIDTPDESFKQRASDERPKAEAPKLASLPELPVEPGYPGLAVAISEPNEHQQETSPPSIPAPAAPVALKPHKPAPVPAAPAALKPQSPAPAPAPVTPAPLPGRPEARPMPPSQSAPMPPVGIGPQSLRLAAARGNPQAQFEIASRYAKGSGVAQDFKKASDWYARAAAKGLAPAQYRLAALYERGRGVKPDTALAKVWYERAAKKGNVKAMHNLAVLYTGANGHRTDHVEAAKWFTEAARYGLTDSQFNLGILYEAGLGVTKNPLEAYKWFSLAAAHGDEDAAARQRGIRLQTRRDLIERADQTVRLWRAKRADKGANEVRSPEGGWRGAAASSGTTKADALILRAQKMLNKLGYNAGTADGVAGPQTDTAVRRFQTRSGLTPTGEITPGLVRRLEALSG